jgi:hypothetical protein
VYAFHILPVVGLPGMGFFLAAWLNTANLAFIRGVLHTNLVHRAQCAGGLTSRKKLNTYVAFHKTITKGEIAYKRLVVIF